MPGWAPFLTLTAALVVLLLALARLSEGVVRPDQQAELESGSHPTEPSEEASLYTPFYRRKAAHTDPLADGVVVRQGDRDFSTGDPSPIADRHRVPSTEALLANVAVTQAFFGTMLVVGLYVFEIPGPAVGVTGGAWNTGLPAVGVGVAFGVGLWLANETAAAVADAVGASYDERLRGLLTPDGPGGWLVLLGLVLPMIAVVEELLFRAAIIGAGASGMGVSPWLLAIVSAIAFAFGHGAQGRIGIAVTGGLGFVLAAGFVLSGSLLVVVLAHYVVNALEFVVHEGLEFDGQVADTSR